MSGVTPIILAKKIQKLESELQSKKDQIESYKLHLSRTQSTVEMLSEENKRLKRLLDQEE